MHVYEYGMDEFDHHPKDFTSGLLDDINNYFLFFEQ